MNNLDAFIQENRKFLVDGFQGFIRNGSTWGITKTFGIKGLNSFVDIKDKRATTEGFINLSKKILTDST